MLEQKKPSLAILAEDHPKIRSLINNEEEINGLINYAVNIFSVNPKEEESFDVKMTVIIDFITSKFGGLTIPEIREAFKMAVAREFQEIKVFRLLDCVSVGEILTAYTNYKSDQLRLYQQKKSIAILEAKKETVSKAESDEIMKKGINERFSLFLETNEVFDPVIHVFKFLIENNVLKMPNSQTPKITAYYQGKYEQAKKLVTTEVSQNKTDSNRKQFDKIIISIQTGEINSETELSKSMVELMAKKLVIIDLFNKYKADGKKEIFENERKV